MVSLIFSNVAIDLMKSWDQLSSKTLMLKAPVFRYPSSLISESTQIKLFEVAKVHVCRFKGLGPICFSPTQVLFMLLSVIAIQV